MPFEIHFGHITVAEMVNYTLEVPKAITKRIALAGTEWQPLVENLMPFDYFEVHFLSYEGSELCKLHKIRPKRQLQREMPWLAQNENL